MMCKSKSGLDLDVSPIFIENGLDLNILLQFEVPGFGFEMFGFAYH